MSTSFTTRPLTETDYDRWTALVSAAPSGSIYALPAYLEILCSTAGGRFEILGVFHGDELVGGMPLYLRQTRWGEIITRRYFLAYPGPVVRAYTSQTSSAHTRQLAALAALEASLRTFPCAHMVLCARHSLTDVRPFLAHGWGVTPEYTYLVNITDLNQTWQRIDQNQRRLIKRAQEEGLHCTDDEDVDTLYRMHVSIHQRKSAYLYMPEIPFRAFVTRLQDQNLCHIFHARLADGRPVASQLVLTGPHSICDTVCAGSDQAFLTTGANPFLRWKVFAALSAAGYLKNDLTGALYPHPVTRFKSQLGGELVTNWVLTRPETLRYRLRLQLNPLIKTIKFAMRKVRGCNPLA